MRWFVGVLLIVAATLKAVQFLLEPTALHVRLLSGWLLPMQISAELGLGLLILNGRYWGQLRRLILLLFITFAAYSLNVALSGAASCDCFGIISVHPWWTFVLDVAVVLGISASTLKHDRHQTASSVSVSWLHRPTDIAAVVGLPVILAAILIWHAKASRTTLTGNALPAVGNVVMLEPESWIGKPFPISDAIDLDMSEGEWIVLLHRHSCTTCKDAVAHYEHLALFHRDKHVALIEVPPFGHSTSTAADICHRTRLSENWKWYVETPVEIQLKDGVVSNTSRELTPRIESSGY